MNDSGRVLVTGAAGFLGRRVVRRLVESGWPVVLFDRTEPSELEPQARFVRGEITDREALTAAAEGCTCVVHCAGEKRDASHMRAVNVKGTRAACKAVTKAKAKVLCHLSSAGVAGRVRSTWVREETQGPPMNAYEATKREAEDVVRSAEEIAHRVILRPTNLFGPDTVRAALRAESLLRMKWWLKGRECAHWVYVEDVAAAAAHFALHPPATPCETYVVSSDEEPGNTHAEILAQLRALDGRARSTVAWSPPLIVPWLFRFVRRGRTNRGDVRYSAQRLHQAGFRLPYGLRQGLRHAFEQLQEARTA